MFSTAKDPWSRFLVIFDICGRRGSGAGQDNGGFSTIEAESRSVGKGGKFEKDFRTNGKISGLKFNQEDLKLQLTVGSMKTAPCWSKLCPFTAFQLRLNSTGQLSLLCFSKCSGDVLTL